MSHNHRRPWPPQSNRIIRYLHFSLKWTSRLRGQFWTRSLNEIAETRLARCFGRIKNELSYELCREGPSLGTTDYIRSESRVSIISSMISRIWSLEKERERERERERESSHEEEYTRRRTCYRVERWDRKVAFVIEDFLETSRGSL